VIGQKGRYVKDNVDGAKDRAGKYVEPVRAIGARILKLRPERTPGPSLIFASWHNFPSHSTCR